MVKFGKKKKESGIKNKKISFESALLVADLSIDQKIEANIKPYKSIGNIVDVSLEKWTFLKPIKTDKTNNTKQILLKAIGNGIEIVSKRKKEMLYYFCFRCLCRERHCSKSCKYSPFILSQLNSLCIAW